MRHFLRAVLVALVLASVLPHLLHAQVPPVRERLGGRIGYVDTYGKFHENFGEGWNATIYFTERLYHALFLDIKIGAIYMGDLLRPEVAEPFFGSSEFESEMRVLFFSVGPQLALPLGDSPTAYVGVGVGVYSSSILFTTTFQSGDISDQHLGANGSVGILLRFTETWNLDFNLTVHHYRTSSSINDIFYVFTGQGAQDPILLQAAIGITIDLD